MNVLIFAAGLGTRLKPITDTMPKALVPVQGRPLLSILIEKLKRELPEGERLTVTVNVHHFAGQIITYLHQNDNFGIDIRISDESDCLLDTGGGMKKAIDLFDDNEPILVHNVDILSDMDIVAFHDRATRAIKSSGDNIGAVLEVSLRKSSRYLLFDDQDRLCGWTNVNTGEVKTPYPSIDITKLRKYAFSGIHVVNPKLLLQYMDKWEGKFSIIDFYLSVCDRISIICEPNSKLNLIDVGKFETLSYLCNENLDPLI